METVIIGPVGLPTVPDMLFELGMSKNTTGSPAEPFLSLWLRAQRGWRRRPRAGLAFLHRNQLSRNVQTMP